MAKTTPTSIRFEQTHFDFIKERERLDKPQAIVNFLLQDYWVRNKLLPEKLLAAKYSDFYKHENKPSEFKDEKSGFSISVATPKIKRSAANYAELILECVDSEEYAKLYAEIDAAEHLTDKEKNKLLKR